MPDAGDWPSDESAVITTERLQLLPLVRAHADLLFELLADATQYEYTQDEPPASVDDLRDRYSLLESRRSPDGTQVWLNWMLQEADEAIGYVQATVVGDAAEVAWVVGRSWKGRGYATEAAGAMIEWLTAAGVRVIRAKIRPGHTASQRVAAKIGLSPAGEFVDGEEIWEFER